MDRPVSIHDITGQHKASGSQICYQVCPFCKDERWKFYINPENGRWFCFAGAHYTGGVLDTTPQEEEDKYSHNLLAMLQPKVKDIEYQDIMLPPFVPLSLAAHNYLNKRGLEDRQLAEYGMVEQASEPRVIIPFVEWGCITYWIARAYGHVHGPKYMYPTGIDKRPFKTHAGAGGPLVIVEGIFDALAVERAGYRSVALGGKTIVQSAYQGVIELCGQYEQVMIMLDWDALADALALKDRLEVDCGGEVHIRPCTAKDPAEMTREEIQKAVNRP